MNEIKKDYILTIIEEKAYTRGDDGKKEEVKNEEGKISYVRNDYSGLQALLGKFDTRTHTIKDWKEWLKVKEKVMSCYLEENKKLELSFNEMIFLKNYFTDLVEKNNSKAEDREKIVFREFELRTLMGMMEQLKEF